MRNTTRRQCTVLLLTLRRCGKTGIDRGWLGKYVYSVGIRNVMGTCFNVCTLLTEKRYGKKWYKQNHCDNNNAIVPIGLYERRKKFYYYFSTLGYITCIASVAPTCFPRTSAVIIVKLQNVFWSTSKWPYSFDGNHFFSKCIFKGMFNLNKFYNIANP